jgi:hypothetical protein
VTPRYSDPASWSWEERGPVLVNEINPGFAEGGAECAAFPSDPGAASALVTRKLREFDERASPGRSRRFPRGAASVRNPHRHVRETRGQRPRRRIRFALRHHRAVRGRAAADRQAVIARVAIHREEAVRVAAPQVREQQHAETGGVGAAARPAVVTFLIPRDAAPGPAEVAVVRTDGTSSKTHAVLERVAPGLMSASVDGRGVAKAWAGDVPVFRCAADCEALPIPAGATVRFIGTGFRNARSVRVIAGEKTARVISYGAMREPGRDELKVEMPEVEGDADVLLWADGVLSNVVRVRASTPGELALATQKAETFCATRRQAGHYVRNYFNRSFNFNRLEAAARTFCPDYAFARFAS